MYLGNCSIFYSKFLEILKGFKLIQYGGYDKVIIQSDKLEVVKPI